MKTKFIAGLCAAFAIGSVHAQSECQPKPATKQSPLAACNARMGHCVDVKMGGVKSELHNDAALNAKLGKALGRDKPCWKVATPVPADFLLTNEAKAGSEAWLGEVTRVGLVLYALDDFDEALGRPIEPMSGANVVDGRIEIAPRGADPLPLKPGEYVAIFRFFGSSNWERQAIFFTVAK